jgi:arginase
VPEPAVIALLCRTSDRTVEAGRGAEVLAGEIARRLAVEPRLVGSPGEPRTARFDEDLKESHGCLLEAGGQVDDALEAARQPVLCASDCSIALTTLPAVARLVPGVRVLWLDAHGDFNTPETSTSGFLGGMCLAGACGRWDTGFDGTIDPAAVVMHDARDLDAAERAELDLAGVRRIEHPNAVPDALEGAPVFVHLDFDVLDPTIFPAQFPAPGGRSPAGLSTLLRHVRERADRIVGVELTAFEAPDDDEARARLVGIATGLTAALLESAR